MIVSRVLPRKYQSLLCVLHAFLDALIYRNLIKYVAPTTHVCVFTVSARNPPACVDVFVYIEVLKDFIPFGGPWNHCLVTSALAFKVRVDPFPYILCDRWCAVVLVELPAANTGSQSSS